MAFLSMDDYRLLGAALEASEKAGENPLAIRAVRLLALTGCRRSEVVHLTWPGARLGQVAFVGPAGQPQDLGYSRARLVVGPVGIDEDKGLAGDVLDLN